MVDFFALREFFTEFLLLVRDLEIQSARMHLNQQIAIRYLIVGTICNNSFVIDLIKNNLLLTNIDLHSFGP